MTLTDLQGLLFVCIRWSCTEFLCRDSEPLESSCRDKWLKQIKSIPKIKGQQSKTLLHHVVLSWLYYSGGHDEEPRWGAKGICVHSKLQ